MPKFAHYVGTNVFWREYKALSAQEREAADELFRKFKEDPFSRELGTHKIIRLSALRKEAVWSVRVLADLRVLFVVRGDTIFSISIGTHDIYK